MKNFTLNSLLILLSLVFLNCSNNLSILKMSLNQLEQHLEKLKVERTNDPESDKLLSEYVMTAYLLDPDNKIPSKIFRNADILIKRRNFLHGIFERSPGNKKESIPEGVSSACFCADYFNGANSYGQTSSQKQKCNKMYICLANAMKDCIGGTSNVWSRSDC